MFNTRLSYPKERGGPRWIFIALFSVSLIFFALAKVLPRGSVEKRREEMRLAARIMANAGEALRNCLAAEGLGEVADYDINRTGLIGVEWSGMTTSVGSLEAKRTTTNPNTAALVAYLLGKAGVRKGDAVAVGGSGSFPALIVAVMSAAKALEAEPLIICSLGASQWGANRPEFHFLAMLECLWAAGIFDVRPVAVSLGGERDAGEGMAPEMRNRLIEEIEVSGIPFIRQPELSANVREKMKVYEERAGGKGIKCFINIGGSWSNMGVDSEILKVKPGLAGIRNIPPAGRRGMVFEMAARGVPVLHLLYIKGLAESYGLPWDPSPLPQAGSGSIYEKPVEDQPLFNILGGSYLVIVLLLILLYARLKRRGNDF